MTERDSNSGSDHGRGSPGKDEVIPGRHGKHGGGMESEGAPQKDTREANEPAKPDHSDQTDDGE